MNNVQLIGNITKDVELKYSTGGAAYCRFAIAVNKKTRDSERTDYINCVAWNGRAQTISQYFHKGDKIGITGELQTSSKDNGDGTRSWFTDVLVSGFDFCNARKNQEQASYPSDLNVTSDELPF